MKKAVTFEQAEEDLDALVDYVCERFGQDKVSHYIGIGQEVLEEDWYSYAYVYEDALAKAKAIGDDITELEAVYEAFIKNPNLVNMNAISNASYQYHPVKVTEYESTAAMLFSLYMGVDDIRWYLLLNKRMRLYIFTSHPNTSPE